MEVSARPAPTIGKTMNTFTKYDVVKYDTGTTYIVYRVEGPQTLRVVSFKNGKAFGAIRFIDPARCALIGRATRDYESGAYSFNAVGE